MAASILELTNGTAPSAPSSGLSDFYVDSTSTLLSCKNSSGNIIVNPLEISNQSVTVPGAGFSSDTYLVGSSITMPTGFPHVGSLYHLVFDVSKTGAGSATPILSVRYGTAGTTGDTARLTFTFGNGTAASDTGMFEVWACFQSVGASTAAVLQGSARCTHGASATTGIINLVAQQLQVTSSGFDSTPANSIIGCSVNGGASAAWTIAMVRADFTSF